MKSNPQLIPADDLGLEGDLLVVGRETILASGAIDLLCLAKSGDLVLIEFKTGPKNPDFRHALAQVIDYGSDLWQRSLEDFDRGVVQRYLAGPHRGAKFAAATSLDDVINMAPWDLAAADVEALKHRLTEVLAAGDFTYVVAAQRFTNSMTRSLDYLNATMREGRFFLIELVKLAGSDLSAYAAQVVSRPTRTDGGSSTAGDGLEFLDSIVDQPFREAIQDIIASCQALGLVVAPGSKGLSLRIGTDDGPEPLSIGWILPPGSQWNGATNLTLGVDPSSLKKRPSVAKQVQEYVASVKQIADGQPVKSSIDARMFAPTVVPGIKDEVVRAIERLIESNSDTTPEEAPDHAEPQVDPAGDDATESSSLDLSERPSGQ